jgi:hypothetical protein
MRRPSAAPRPRQPPARVPSGPPPREKPRGESGGAPLNREEARSVTFELPHDQYDE